MFIIVCITLLTRCDKMLRFVQKIAHSANKNTNNATSTIILPLLRVYILFRLIKISTFVSKIRLKR